LTQSYDSAAIRRNLGFSFYKIQFYFLYFEVIDMPKWCQKWDAISKICRLPINSMMFNAIIRTIYFKSFSIIYNLLPINNHLKEYVKIKNQQNLLLK